MRDAAADFRAAIHRALGYAPEAIEPGQLHRFPTNDKRRDTAGYCKLFDDQRGGIYGDHRSGVHGHWQAEQRRERTPAERASYAREIAQGRARRHAQQVDQWARNGQRIALLWEQCRPLVAGDPVTRYFEGRGIDAATLPPTLRHHPALAYWDAGARLGHFPAMVAPLVAPDGRTVALHRTFLTVDGYKADVPAPKKLTPACGPIDGACIQLHNISAPTRAHRCIGIAEGIETAQAARCITGVPTVAAYCAHNLETWRWPAGLERLLIFADADAAGRSAAAALHARAKASRLAVQILTPSDEGADWCDVWAQRGAVLIDAGHLSAASSA